LRGKYKRRRERKKYAKYAEAINYYRNNPYKFAEEMLGIKLFWYQKLMLKMSMKGVTK